MSSQIPLSLLEIQQVEYDILKNVVDLLDNNGLGYILCGGTLLGAIRHKGFIPWDDDIDILIPRNDYEKLKRIIKDHHGYINGIHYRLPGEQDYFYPFIKAENPRYICQDDRLIPDHPFFIWVDIFPLDHFPDDEARHQKAVRDLTVLKTALYAGILVRKTWAEGSRNTLVDRMRYCYYRMLYFIWGGHSGISKRIDQYALNMNARYEGSDHVGDGAWPEGMKDYFRVSDTYPTILHEFESGSFCIPANYDGYLRQFYGDYMTPPPPEKRVGHRMKAYRTEDRT